MEYRTIFVALIGLACSALALPVHAAPNLVTNGSFETFTATGGSSQVTNTNTTGWSTTSGYTFVVTAASAMAGFTGPSGSLSFYGSITASPDGGNFLASDGGYLTGYESQTIVGMVTGATYAVSFWMAAAQQTGFTGATTDKWTVGLGTTYATSTFKDSTTINLASQAYSGWVQQTLTFVAAASTQVLSFLAVGTPAGQPPFALLDGVTVTQVPEPPAYGMIVIGLLGLLGIRRIRNRRA